MIKSRAPAAVLAGLLAAMLLLDGCSSTQPSTEFAKPNPTVPASPAPTQPAPAQTPKPAVPTDPTTGKPYLRITAAEQFEAESVVRSYFDALVHNDIAGAYALWGTPQHPSSTVAPGTKSGIVAVKRLDFSDWQTTNANELDFNISVELTIADGAATAWGPGPSNRAVRLVQENGRWAIDAMASGPLWPAVDTSRISNATQH